MRSRTRSTSWSERLRMMIVDMAFGPLDGAEVIVYCLCSPSAGSGPAPLRRGQGPRARSPGESVDRKWGEIEGRRFVRQQRADRLARGCGEGQPQMLMAEGVSQPGH